MNTLWERVNLNFAMLLENSAQSCLFLHLFRIFFSVKLVVEQDFSDQ